MMAPGVNGVKRVKTGVCGENGQTRGKGEVTVIGGSMSLIREREMRSEPVQDGAREREREKQSERESKREKNREKERTRERESKREREKQRKREII